MSDHTLCHPTLTFDYHTKQFFDPADWEAPVEARFHLDAPGIEDLEFRGRIERFCTGDLSIVLQAVGGDGSTFVRRLPGHMAKGECTPEEIGRHWKVLLSIQRVATNAGTPPPILPELAGSCGLSRLHFGRTSGFGVLVCSQGPAYLYDLRDVESAEKAHHPFVDLGDAVCPEGIAALVEMPGEEFHARLGELIGDQSSALFQTLRFYHQSDDERCQEVFGCDYRTLKATMEALTLALTVALGLGGELWGLDRAVWHPWSAGENEVSVHQGQGWWEDCETPEWVAGMLEKIGDRMGCHLRLERQPKSPERVVDARTVALEWANEFNVRAKAPSAHEAMEAAARLRERLR